jgi:hypothetical protein
VDWAIHALGGDKLLYYWYNALRKSYGFVINKKHEKFVVNVVLKAKMIPNSCVTLLVGPSKVALVTSRKHPHKKYWVHNLEFEWASCDYPCA